MGVALEVKPPRAEAAIEKSTRREPHDAERCCLLPIHGRHSNSVILSINPDVCASMVQSQLDASDLPQTILTTPL